MTKFEIYYTMISHRTCVVEAQNEDQIRFLFENERLDLDNEHHGSLDYGDLKSIEKIEENNDE